MTATAEQHRAQDRRECEEILLEAIEERLVRHGLSASFQRPLRPRADAPLSVQRGIVVLFCVEGGRCWRRSFFADLLDQATDRRELGMLIDREILWSLKGPPQPRGSIPDVAIGDADAPLADEGIRHALSHLSRRTR